MCGWHPRADFHHQRQLLCFLMSSRPFVILLWPWAPLLGFYPSASVDLCFVEPARPGGSLVA